MTQMANERVSLHVDYEQQADTVLFKIRDDFESTSHFLEQRWCQGPQALLSPFPLDVETLLYCVTPSSTRTD